MTPLHLRDLAEADLPAIHAWMRGATEAPRWSDVELLQLASAAGGAARRQRKSWVAEDSAGALLGFAVAVAVSIIDAPAECELEFVFVSPQERRAGVGRALLQGVLDWARELSASEVWLEVRTSNLPAIALYAAGGFTAAGRRPGYYVDPSEDAVLMRCGIDVASEDRPV